MMLSVVEHTTYASVWLYKNDTLREKERERERGNIAGKTKNKPKPKLMRAVNAADDDKKRTYSSGKRNPLIIIHLKCICNYPLMCRIQSGK